MNATKESLWAASARMIVPIDAMAGITLNIILIFVLIRIDIGKTAQVFRITIMITAILGTYFSLLLLLIQDVFIINDGNIANVLYGPILYYLPERVNDILVTAFLTNAHTLWQILPGPSIVQWMHLTKRNSSTLSRLIFAYIVPVICQANTWYFMSFNVIDQTFRSELVTSITILHGSDPESYHVYGVKMIDNDKIDLLDMLLYDVLPSYVVCYGIFTFAAIQIQLHLRAYGNGASRKTIQMQRRFLRSQIAQVFIPLVLTSIPVTITLVASLNGLNLANASFLPIYSFWLMPSATAALYQLFVTKSSKRTAKTSTTSTSQVEQIKPGDVYKMSIRLDRI